MSGRSWYAGLHPEDLKRAVEAHLSLGVCESGSENMQFFLKHYRQVHNCSHHVVIIIEVTPTLKFGFILELTMSFLLGFSGGRGRRRGGDGVEAPAQGSVLDVGLHQGNQPGRQPEHPLQQPHHQVKTPVQTSSSPVLLNVRPALSAVTLTFPISFHSCIYFNIAV